MATPEPVVFADNDGSANDWYTIPTAEGVDYLVGSSVVGAGTYPGRDTVTVTARARTGYMLAAGAAKEWSHTFDASAIEPDTAGPVLVSSSVSPTSFNLDDGPGVVKVSVRLTDQTGARAPTVVLSHDSGQSQGFGSMMLVSGDAKDGVWERTMEIPQGAATGQWDVDLYSMSDTLGNISGGFQTISRINVARSNVVTPAAVVFVDKDGTAEDSYTVPATKGVEYRVGDNMVESGTYSATGTVTVKARAKNDYFLAEGAAAEWTATFKATPYTVTPAAVVFTDKDGTAEDTYTVPSTEGIEYLLGDTVVEAGTHQGTGAVTVKARAKTDYVLAAGATFEWSATFKATPYKVTPAAVAFTDRDGTADDSYKVPVTEGVEYLLGDSVVGAGTYPGSGTVTVTARAKTDHVFAEGAAAEWSFTFKATPYKVTPAAVVFTDDDGTAEDT
jgi:serine protease